MSSCAIRAKKPQGQLSCTALVSALQHSM